MVPLYAARIEDLGPGDFVRVECAACGHDALIHPSALPNLQFQPQDLVLGLERRLRCRECDTKGKVVVSIRWKEQRKRSRTRGTTLVRPGRCPSVHAGLVVVGHLQD